ncbi:polysaccharide biosynthesis/export family protein [Galbibacter sp. EGI 63066]|uniref:polysaccharide biosynthesis/export family protein n=1 Tax=Galbibacter sp. EGI 63066 TaxID=2993559 RepID=UPI0022496C27|nr:polysaccharide biosynthesis/export family protein [Galbibacter sp. EGI 63066]MCX2679159.1 polysaccharide biosynthesis/export family protein [Galbibacter sp. EGI 63066]
MGIKYKKGIIWILLIWIFVSCGSRKDIVYMQNAKKFETEVETNTFEPKFKIDDILSIYISSIDMASTSPFNLARGAGENLEELEYVIDKEGNIDFPVLGKIKLIGLSTGEAKELIRKRLVGGGYLKDPIVNIRIKNFRVTVLGQVRQPGTYSIAGERVTILEALGLAGDLDIRGRRDNVLVIRDFNGVKTYTRINLTSKEFMRSPVYYLTQNDVVYVEPNKSVVKSSNLDNRTSVGISILSVLIASIIAITR